MRGTAQARSIPSARHWHRQRVQLGRVPRPLRAPTHQVHLERAFGFLSGVPILERLAAGKQGHGIFGQAFFGGRNQRGSC